MIVTPQSLRDPESVVQVVDKGGACGNRFGSTAATAVGTGRGDDGNVGTDDDSGVRGAPDDQGGFPADSRPARRLERADDRFQFRALLLQSVDVGHQFGHVDA